MSIQCSLLGSTLVPLAPPPKLFPGPHPLTHSFVISLLSESINRCTYVQVIIRSTIKHWVYHFIRMSQKDQWNLLALEMGLVCRQVRVQYPREIWNYCLFSLFIGKYIYYIMRQIVTFLLGCINVKRKLSNFFHVFNLIVLTIIPIKIAPIWFSKNVHV